MVAFIVFIMATLEVVFGRKKLLDGKGPFGDNVFKNPARRFCKISSVDAKWPEMSFATSKWRTLKDRQNSLETSSRFFENQPREICRHSSEKASKGRFFGPDKLQNHTNQG